MKRTIFPVLFFLFCAYPLFGQKSLYLEEIRKAAEKGWKDSPDIIARWKKTSSPSVLWGYDAPGHPVYLANALAFLYSETRQKNYAERAASLLGTFGDLREALPPGYAKTRAEYAQGVPSLANFFYLPPYVRAYLQIRDSGALDSRMREKIEKEVAESVDFIFHFPEWGAHNRAMLRAETLYYAYLALPGHPRAKSWKQMAEVIAGDSIGQWEIEDTSLYSPIWLHALFSYADAAKREDAFTSAPMRYYMEYFTRLIAPTGMIPDYGDAWWNSSSSTLLLVSVFEKGASTFRSAEMKWAAQSILNTVMARVEVLGVVEACSLVDAYRWADETIQPAKPGGSSQEVLDDAIGKKIVFRSGWDSSSTYLLLNYRDEGDGGWGNREYLRQTISVEEEKMHHGHADENSVVLLMNKGSVLLHDAGYRSDLPSGKYGEYRQDYFHNRVVARKNKRDKTQSLLEFVRNSGAYRAVKTKKVDFLNLRDVDMSRTRVEDENMGYRWDRVITYVRDPGFFIVVDGIRALATDYFTFSNFWHAQKILSKGERYFDVATDSLPGFTFPENQSLLVYFPERYAKSTGEEPINRHSQLEHAIYQTVSSQYKAGDSELFVTILAPHGRSAKLDSVISQFKLTSTSAPGRSVGIQIGSGNSASFLCVKLDLEMEVARENIRPRYLYELGKVRYGDIETDAHFLFARREGDTLHYSASNVLKVLHGSKVLMQALPNTFGLQLDGEPDRVGYSKWRYWEDSAPVR